MCSDFLRAIWMERWPSEGHPEWRGGRFWESGRFHKAEISSHVFEELLKPGDCIPLMIPGPTSPQANHHPPGSIEALLHAYTMFWQ